MLAALRYLLFVAAAALIASALFFVLSVLITANYDVGRGMIERWIVRATCSQYELEGTVRDTGGTPVAFATIEVSYAAERLTTRSNGDGTFILEAEEAICDRRPPANVGVLVMAEGFRPKRQSLPFDTGSVDVKLDARDFRP
jgi:hypothetical protein